MADSTERHTLYYYAAVLMRRWRVVALALAASLLYAASSLVGATRSYSATAVFVPESAARSEASPLAGVAAQFGVNVGGGQGQTPYFYVDLLSSRTILWAVANRTYSYRSDSGEVRGTLVQLYGLANNPPERRRELAVRALRSQIGANPAQRTGVITLRVNASHPRLAEQIATALLQEVNRFDLQSRQSRASFDREFIEQRVAEARSDLLAAERRLESFLQLNREFRSSPKLVFDQDRLAREVTMRQQLYTSLVQSLQQARIDEVRNRPSIVVLDPPAVPVGTEPTGQGKRLLWAVVGGLLLGGVLAFILEFLRAQRSEQPTEYEEFRRVLSRVFRRPLRA